MILSAAAFGSSGTVGIFGFNIYIVERDDLVTAPKDSAVIVTKCSAYDVTKDRLILFTDNDGNTNLDYAESFEIVDGIYYITTKGGAVFSEKQMIGSADYDSVFLGNVIGFVKTPFGVFCIALLPCIVLIIFDIIRAAAAKMPPPEVEPQIKNLSEEQKPVVAGISVKSDGKAVYSRNTPTKPATNADDVLYSYTARQKKAAKPPIIPLTDKKPEVKTEEKPATNSVIQPSKTRNAGTMPKEDTGKTPVGVAVSRYTQNLSVSGTTTEIPIIPKKDEDSDAFFAQTSPRKAPPQISRLLPKNEETSPAKEDKPEREEKEIPGTGRRSTEILAGKSAADLLSDEDDIRDKNRYDVDVILAGLERKDKME